MRRRATLPLGPSEPLHCDRQRKGKSAETAAETADAGVEDSDDYVMRASTEREVPLGISRRADLFQSQLGFICLVKFAARSHRGSYLKGREDPERSRPFSALLSPLPAPKHSIDTQIQFNSILHFPFPTIIIKLFIYVMRRIYIYIAIKYIHINIYIYHRSRSTDPPSLVHTCSTTSQTSPSPPPSTQIRSQRRRPTTASSPPATSTTLPLVSPAVPVSLSLSSTTSVSQAHPTPTQRTHSTQPWHSIRRLQAYLPRPTSASPPVHLTTLQPPPPVANPPCTTLPLLLLLDLVLPPESPLLLLLPA